MGGIGLLALWCLVHALVAYVGARWARRHALRHGLLDQPGERRSHAVPTPRGGGLGIAASWLLACGWLALLPGVDAWLALALGVAMLCVAGIGWWDDRRPLPVLTRLLVQLVGASAAGLGFWAASGSVPVAAISVCAVMVLVNVWNFMDGIDGLAATQGAIAAFALGWWGGSVASVLLGLGLAGACLGFLPLNFPRARIFLGDVGSGAVGLGIAVLLVMAGMARWTGGDGLASVAIVALPVAVFMVDATLTLAGRIVRGERWWTPHVGHAYQKLAARRGLHVPVTIAYGVASGAAVGLAMVLPVLPRGVQVPVLVAGVVALAVVWGWVQSGRTTGLAAEGSRK